MIAIPHVINTQCLRLWNRKTENEKKEFIFGDEKGRIKISPEQSIILSC